MRMSIAILVLAASVFLGCQDARPNRSVHRASSQLGSNVFGNEMILAQVEPAVGTGRSPSTLRIMRETMLSLLLALYSSGLDVGYEKALKSGFDAIPMAAEFRRVFPTSQHFLTYFTGCFGPESWNSKIGLHGRYVLTMKMDVKVDYNLCTIVEHGQPAFYLHEIRAIWTLADGRRSIDYQAESQRAFGTPEWRRLVESRGDLSVLGIQVKTNQPIPSFEEVWK